MNDTLANLGVAPNIDTDIDCVMPVMRVVQFYEHLDLASLAQVSTIYTKDASFKDPFNEVSGHAAIRKIFEHMFLQVQHPTFRVTAQIIDGDQAFLTWNFEFQMKRFSSSLQCIRGASHLRFTDEGQVSMHRDYWDAAEELYEKLPVLGALMRTLKRIART